MSRASKLLKELGELQAPQLKLNIKDLPLVKAREFADKEFKKNGRDLDKEFPNFNKNYKLLQSKMKSSLNIKRADMPVIRSKNLKQFQKDLATGRIDIFKPFAGSAKELFPKDLLAKPEKGKEWLLLGLKDGDLKDDVIKGQVGKSSVKNLQPTQNQIW